MNIIEKEYNWNGSLDKRYLTKYIVLHHRAGDGDAQSIHRQHVQSNGWTGIGYHFYVRKDGSVYRGRPIEVWGAHCVGYNDKSVAICFEGNFENEAMTAQQLKAGKEIVSYLKGLYPSAELKRHRDLESTACPGKKFPFEDIKKGVQPLTAEEAAEIVKKKAGLSDKTIDFLKCYKYEQDLLKKLAEAME